MTIDITKKYKTKDGHEVELYKIVNGHDPKNCQVIGAFICASGTYCPVSWHYDGRYTACDKLSLVEVTPWEDFNIDDKVLCWNGAEGGSATGLNKRHFAGIAANGKPMTFADGKTSWSNNGKITLVWEHCVKADAVDLSQSD